MKLISDKPYPTNGETVEENDMLSDEDKIIIHDVDKPNDEDMSGLSISSDDNNSEDSSDTEDSDDEELLIVGVRKTKK